MTTWGRTLPKNDDVAIPGSIVCVEVATVSTTDALNPKKRTHRLRCGAAIAGRMEQGKWTRENQLTFASREPFWEWLNYRRVSGKPVWCFSANLSDTLALMGFWSDLETGVWRLTKTWQGDLTKIRSGRLKERLSRTEVGILVDADPPTVLMCWHRDGWKLILLDLRNYWDKAPEQLAKLSGQNLEDPPNNLTPEASALEWCESACRVTQQCVARLAGWHRSNEMGRFGWTVAGMAMAGFRHRYMRHKIELPPSQDDRDLERRAYFNGRTEALWIGEVRHGRYHPPSGCEIDRSLFTEHPRGPYHLVDARSFYGAVAAFQSVPFRCVGEGEEWPSDEAVNGGLNETHLAEVLIRSESHEFPVHVGDRTLYATGSFWTVLCGPELARALKAGAVSSVARWRQYEIEPILRPYALGIWDERIKATEAGDELLSSLCKALLARLHGKFVQREAKWKVSPDDTAPRPWHRWTRLNTETDEVEHFRSIGWEVQKQQTPRDAKFSFPAIAAWVTAWGREYLRHWMQVAGTRNVLYVSTDSLIVTEPGRANLEKHGIIGNYGIGSCRVVNTADSVEVNGPNDFRIGNKRIFAGLPIGSVSCGGHTASYSVRPSLRSIITGTPGETIAETVQTGKIDATGDIWRLTKSGFLTPIKLQLDENLWAGPLSSTPTLKEFREVSSIYAQTEDWR